MKFYHGSPHIFNVAAAGQFFIAKDAAYARRYGANLYEVEFSGSPEFETNTILVVNSRQITKLTLVECRENATIYGK